MSPRFIVRGKELEVEYFGSEKDNILITEPLNRAASAVNALLKGAHFCGVGRDRMSRVAESSRVLREKGVPLRQAKTLVAMVERGNHGQVVFRVRDDIRLIAVPPKKRFKDHRLIR